MNVVVCIKQVPGTTEVKIDPATNTLVREGVESIINPFDTYAVEEGVRLKERYGGKVTVLTMGPPQAEQALREAISCGADDGVLISDRAFAGSDTLATSRVLAATMNKLADYDLVICGRQTLDGDTGQVGPGLAQRLGIPFLAYVSRVEEVGEGSMRAERMIEEGHEEMELPLPAVITVVKEINVPRLPSLRGTARSRSIHIPTWTAADLGLCEEEVGVAGSPTRVIKIFFPRRERHSEVLSGSPQTQVEQLVERIRGII